MMIPDRDKWSMIDVLGLIFNFLAVSFVCMSSWRYQFVNCSPGVKYADRLSLLERHQIRWNDPWSMFSNWFSTSRLLVSFACFSRYQFVTWSPGVKYADCLSPMWRYQKRSTRPWLHSQCDSQLCGNWFGFLQILLLRLDFWYRWFVGSSFIIWHDIEAILEW